jgi:hypothetical protein
MTDLNPRQQAVAAIGAFTVGHALVVDGGQTVGL